MLSNSIAASVLAAAYVLTLVLDLNPSIPLTYSGVMPLVTSIGLFYAVHLTAVFYLVLVVRQILEREPFSPAWLSVGVLVWLGAVAAASGAALMWRNLTTFAIALDGQSALALTRAAIVLAVSAGLFVVVALLRWSAPDSRGAWASLMVVVVIASVVAPLVLRGRGLTPLLETRPIEAALDVTPMGGGARVTVIAVDGGSLDFITRAAAEGRLPNFGRILDTGAVRYLATLSPTSAEAVWAAVATGKLPRKNGVKSASTYRLLADRGTVQLFPEYCFATGLVRLGFLAEQPHTSATFRTRTLWSILSTQGFTVGVVAWPLTEPAPVVRGFVVSDSYHRRALLRSGIEQPSAIYPPELRFEAARAMESVAETGPILPAALGAERGDGVPAQQDRGAGAPGVINERGDGVPAQQDRGAGVPAQQDTPARIDRIYDRIAHGLAAASPVQVVLTRYQSLDAIGHHFLRFAAPSDFGDVSDEERRRLGGVLERHYAFIDDAIGRAIAGLAANDLLIVVSGYGMEPVGLGRRLIERAIGDRDLSGTHDSAPDGFLMAYGAPVARGRLLSRASVVDVVPTLLYAVGLPVGRDMDGYVRTDLFQPAFTEDRPITYIPTYDR